MRLYRPLQALWIRLMVSFTRQRHTTAPAIERVHIKVFDRGYCTISFPSVHLLLYLQVPNKISSSYRGFLLQPILEPYYSPTCRDVVGRRTSSTNDNLESSPVNQRPTINWTASLQSTRLHPQYPLLKMNQPQQIQNAKMMASATVLLVGFIFVLYQSRDVTQPPQLVRSSGNLRPAASSSRTRRVSSTSLRAKTSSGCGLWHPSVGDPKTW